MASMRGFRKVEDIKLSEGMSVDALINAYSASGGFTAKKLAVAVDILSDMLSDEASVNFLSFPACIISTGTRGVIKELVKRRLFDVVVTTCGTLDHDLARVWKDYYHGDFMMDDSDLAEKGVNRLGNILIPNECYGEILEEKLQPIFEKIFSEGHDNPSGIELVREVGKHIMDESSIIYWCAKNEIPVVVPGFFDGAFGSQAFFFSQGRDFNVDLLADQKFMSDHVFGAKCTGALMVGGGISKHHTIWWNQFAGGLDRVVYLTSAPEWDGSLSGARIREAVSWGKVKRKARYVTVEGDATINLPLIVAGTLKNLK